jgi:hypothetical protein
MGHVMIVFYIDSLNGVALLQGWTELIAGNDKQTKNK